MKMQAFLRSIVGAAVLACPLGAALADGPVLVDSAKAEFEDVHPGVKKKMLWGKTDAGPYGAFTKFDAGVTNPLHSHTHEIRIVVLQGAYIYKPQNGAEQRAAAGSYFSVPAGDVHVSGADAKEGVLFYEEGAGPFDLKFVEVAKK